MPPDAKKILGLGEEVPRLRVLYPMPTYLVTSHAVGDYIILEVSLHQVRLFNFRRMQSVYALMNVSCLVQKRGGYSRIHVPLYSRLKAPETSHYHRLQSSDGKKYWGNPSRPKTSDGNLLGKSFSGTSLLDTDTQLSHLPQARLVAIELEAFHTKAYTPKSRHF